MGLLFFGLVGGLLSFILWPPFGGTTTARVLLLGLDEADGPGMPRRSDAIILCAARLDGSGTTLMSVPRDALVRIPGYRRANKINAAYALGGVPLLQKTLADADTLGASLPYYLVIDSATVRAVVDALGGIVVDVPVDMDYDDNWGQLHIHLDKGRQRLSGEQAVGYLRWRKNNTGHGGSTDFARTDRQRQLLAAIAAQAQTLDGMRRLPAVYKAFRKHTTSNLSLRQYVMLAWAARPIGSVSIPATTRRGVSYVFCDWAAARALWQAAQ